MNQSEYLFCKYCKIEKELYYQNETVVHESRCCKNTKRINGLKPLDYFFKTYGDNNEANFRRTRKSTKTI